MKTAPDNVGIAQPPRTGLRQTARPRAGSAFIQARRVAGCTRIVRQHAAAPMKLLNPVRGGPAAWVYTSSYGGGLVAGDEVRIDADVGPGATLVLATQASGKVYRSRDDLGATQQLHAAVADGAMLVSVPDPLVCYATAIYEQRQRFEIAAGGSLVMLDWFTCGRLARGERWAFQRYATRTEVALGGKVIIEDALRLDAAHGPIDAPFRTGRFNCFATLMLVGPAAAPAAAAAVAQIGAWQVRPAEDMIASAGAHEWGAIVRVAGVWTERVGQSLAAWMGPLADRLGAAVWERKW